MQIDSLHLLANNWQVAKYDLQELVERMCITLKVQGIFHRQTHFRVCRRYVSGEKQEIRLNEHDLASLQVHGS